MKMRYAIELETSADAAWQVLGEGFGDLSWSSGITYTRLCGELGVGAVRSCGGERFGPFPAGEVSEELTHFDREAMTFRYRGTEGMPWFVDTVTNTWTVHPLDHGRCEVVLEPELVVRWWLRPLQPVVVWMTRGMMRGLLDEMKHRIETGALHPRACARDTRLAAS
ncbi:MAG: SRPBCC family protein [Nannocystales bacterium]